ncbi:hypothetical protein MMC09_000519 [Bachmanniomyces sp. S44760]|nr:hypothetical protein [Bachmanniomyces sp. S44760]
MPLNLSRIKLVHNPKYKRSGLKSYVYLLRKYNITPSKDGPYFVDTEAHKAGKTAHQRVLGGKDVPQNVLQKRVLATGQTGEVTAEDQQNDAEYLCSVSIGMPAQTFNLDFDTGSADLWVFSTELPASVLNSSGTSHNIYDSTKSSTYKVTQGLKWKIAYGDSSSASGTVGTDNVTVGGLTIKNQSIELAKTLSTEFASGVGDGLLGLAFGSINTVTPKPVETPVENMISQDDIPKDTELFTANLGSWRDANDPDKGQSFYTFGFWMFDSTSATVNGKSINRTGNTAIADTGTTLALGDDATCTAIYDVIPGSTYDSTQQGYIFPYSVTADQLPVVTFAVGGKQFAVQKEDVAFQLPSISRPFSNRKLLAASDATPEQGGELERRHHSKLDLRRVETGIPA